MTAYEKARVIARTASEKKGENIILMDMTGISTVCDWFVIVSASSTRRVNTISRAVQKDLSKKKISPLHVEGKHDANWILLDFEDVVVHVFYKEIRDFYGLQRLWSEAPSEEFVGKCLEKI